MPVDFRKEMTKSVDSVTGDTHTKEELSQAMLELLNNKPDQPPQQGHALYYLLNHWKTKTEELVRRAGRFRVRWSTLEL